MDVFSWLDGQAFVWDSRKALTNVKRHAVSFERAREAFLDPLARYENAGPTAEARQACIGLSTDFRLLYVVHVLREGVFYGLSLRAKPRLMRGEGMKMSERIQRNMRSEKPMTLISLRLPDHVIEDLKEIAPEFGFGGYQALIRAYISNGLRQHLAEREKARSREQTMEEFGRRLIAHGVAESAVRDAAAEMLGRS